MIHYIYKITCLLGSLKGHYYIGKHSTTRPQDAYYGSGKILRDYYKKYGKKKGVTFIKDILEYNETYEDNLLREKEIIGDLWQTDPLCMNLCGGGRGPYGIKISEETRQKLRDSHKGKPNPNKGKHLKGHPMSKETKEKISLANSGEKNGMFGKKAWNSGKKCDYCRGKNNHQAKPIEQYTLDGVYIRTWDCLADIKRETDYHGTSHISSCCTGSRNKACGYKWKYAS